MNIAEILGGAIGRFRVDGIEWAGSGAVSLQGFNNQKKIDQIKLTRFW